ncbi:site-2 protease family protein [Altererythrobacter aurantiacus]|uniref:Site-2 protease family protein n=1 Tax=Parapontixanthobacter aurantiacus TaxID=1463599 RepID=A0A844ZFF9_9SPHN|nr:site-2 protease family protein [Parapontixanthobacter aurantiacus]MXO85876.1 site-2 protease family protein [Parapontixanthobacter aurantiacus]
MTDTLTIALVLIPCLIIAIVFHEVAHGWTALALGDPTAKERGRLTLNPIRHVDPVGTLLVPIALALFKGPIFGWAKPVPVLKDRLDNPRWGMVLVAAAGPGINFAMAIVASFFLHTTLPAGAEFAITGAGLPAIADDLGQLSYLSTGLFFFILINLFLGIFNLLPIPPFDGSHIVEGFLPRRLARSYERLRPLGMVLFFGLIALTWFAPQLRIIERLYIPVLYVLDWFMPDALMAF